MTKPLIVLAAFSTNIRELDIRSVKRK